MRKIGRMLSALLVVSMMIVTLVPTGASSTETDGATGDGSTAEDRWDWGLAPYLDEQKNGTFEFKFPYLADTFGYYGNSVPYGDPLEGMFDIRPPEIVMEDGDGGFKVFDETDWNPLYEGDSYTGMDRGVHFAAFMSDNALKTGVEDRLRFYIPVGQEKVIFGSDTTGWTEWGTDYSEYLGTLINNRHTVSLLQSPNIFQYTVGNFTDDKTEEVALYLGETVQIFDSVDGSLKLIKTFRLAESVFGGYNYLNPVDICSGDYNGDGIDDIAVTIEYSRNHTNPYACATDYHESRLTLIDVKNEKVNYNMLNVYGGINEYYMNEYSVVMPSVCLADIDRDAKCEIIVGGYIWDNSYYDLSEFYDPNYHPGELFLAMMEPDMFINKTYPFEAFRFMDDIEYGSMANNGFDGGGRVGFHGDYPNDTSIYLDDPDDNQWGYCRSNSWSNWTVPLIVAQMNGCMEKPVAYFDNAFYTVHENAFSYICAADSVVKRYGNNAMMTNLEKGLVMDRGGDNCMQYEDVFRSIATQTDKKDVDCIADYFTGFLGGVNYHLSYNIISCKNDKAADIPMFYLMDWDPSDSSLNKYLGTVTSVSKPVVMAAISSIPYDEDLAQFMSRGSACLGSTELTKTTSSSTGTATSSTFQVAGGGYLDYLVGNITGHGGTIDGHEFKNTFTITYDTSFSSPNDSMVVMVMPCVYYYYDSYSYVDGEVKKTLQAVTEWDSPIVMMMEFGEYRDFVEDYNLYMSRFCEFRGVDVYEDVPVYNPFSHTVGDISTFDEVPYHPFAEVPVEAKARGDQAYITKGVTLSDSTEKTELSGTVGDLKIELGLLLYISVDMGWENTTSTITTDVSSMSFSSTLANALADEVKKDQMDNVDEILEHYGFIGTFWADDWYEPNAGPVDHVIPYVGYTVKFYNSPGKLGEIDTFTTKENGNYDTYDDGDPNTDDSQHPASLIDRNPTHDQLYLKLTIPSPDRLDQRCNWYQLQMLIDGRDWYNVNDLDFAGIECLVETYNPDGTVSYVPQDRFEPNGYDEIYYVLVKGFENVDLDEIVFRLTSESSENGWFNATLKVEAHLSFLKNGYNTLITDQYELKDGKIFVKQPAPTHEKGLLILNTCLDKGTIIDVIVLSHDGDRVFGEFKGLEIGSQGQIVLETESVPRGDVPAPVTIVFLLGVLLCLGAGAWVLRKD